MPVVDGQIGWDGELARRNYGANSADQEGALALIAAAPAGRFLVLAVGIGLLLFALWQFWSAVVDDDDGLLGIATRIGRVGIGLAYTLIGITGIEAAILGPDATSGSGGPASAEGLTTRLFDLPGGRVATVVIGIGTIVVGVYHLWRGVDGEFLDDIRTDDLSTRGRLVLATLGGVGMVARAVTLAIAGSLFIVAAWQYDPDRAAGLDRSLRSIAEVPLGRGLLALTALGLTAAGLYDMMTFRRQRLV